MISKPLSEAMNLLLWRFVMNKKEFLDILYEQLSGQMPEGNVAAHVQYYRNYIEDAVTQGRTEAEVLNELGDPRLIARTLLDTDSTTSGNPQTTGSYSEPYTDNSYEYDNSSSGSKKVKSRSFHIDLSTWYGKLAVILIAAIVIVLLCTVLSVLIPVMVIFGIECFIISKLRN